MPATRIREVVSRYFVVGQRGPVVGQSGDDLDKKLTFHDYGV